ncbi:MAG: sulfite exporter TauE/SafE family protein [Acidimicrobiia bacterium]|nr:sulfite exporter TauE/SafE family protein [Acidimicrobiia bacterium]
MLGLDVAIGIDPGLVLAGAIVGLTVGLTGMGGGALMTPMLVLLFGVPPLTAVSSDLVVSLVMKPVGGAIHWRRGTVRTDLARWLVVGSVPAAFAGAALVGTMEPAGVEGWLRRALGLALVASAVMMVMRARFAAARGSARAPVSSPVSPALTVGVGAIGGFVVGLTSVGSGTLVIVLLMWLYPTLTPAELVGTDLVQAVPLVGAAAFGHLLFGEVVFALTLSLLVGGIPGVYLGARMSARASQRVVRPALLAVLLTSGLKLLQVI